MGLFAKLLGCNEKQKDMMWTERDNKKIKVPKKRRSDAVVMNSIMMQTSTSTCGVSDVTTEKFNDKELNDLVDTYTEDKGMIETSSDEEEEGDREFIIDTSIFKFETKCTNCLP